MEYPVMTNGAMNLPTWALGMAGLTAMQEYWRDAFEHIPLRATAVPGTSGATQRDQHITTIEKHGRIGWQRRSGYNRRSLVETAMYRYKTIIGRRLYARLLSG
jgi:hypothetical protein